MYVPESENSENSKTVKEGSMKNVQWRVNKSQGRILRVPRQNQ